MADIYQDIEAEIPRLRRYAWVLVHDHSGADDLVQDCLARAIEKQHLWQEGTNLRAWLFSILHNQHINHVRRGLRTGTAVEINEADPQLSRPANQDKCLELRDLERALAQLPEEQRAAILLVGVEGFTYQQVADVLSIPTGTVRSRISRGRDTLRTLMGIELANAAAKSDGDGPRPVQRQARRASHTAGIVTTAWPSAAVGALPAGALRLVAPPQPVSQLSQ